MILAILQARMSSSRLPGKVLKNILGEPMLLRQIERIKRCKNIDRLIVATSDQESDDKIEKVVKDQGIECYRGSLNDVLDRFYKAAQKYNPEHIVRLTADCPLTDWEVIDKVIDVHLNEKNDYTSSALNPTFPDGLDAEIIKYDVLKYVWENARKFSERDNVTIYVYTRPEKFKLGSVESDINLSNLRWTVDEPEDFKLVETIYNRLYYVNNAFLTRDILNLLSEEPKLMKINSKFERNEGLKKSLKNDLFNSKDELYEKL